MGTISSIQTGARIEPMYLSCAQTAQLLRAALKAAFPGVTFGVRSKTYSGGASINVKWTDGPTTAEVELIAKGYQGASFDGSIDLKSYHTSVVNGQPVRFAADFVFCNRTASVSLMQRAIRYAIVRYGWTIEAAAVKAGHFGAELVGLDAPAFEGGFHASKAEIVRQAAYRMRANGCMVTVK